MMGSDEEKAEPSVCSLNFSLFHLSFAPSFNWLCQYGTGIFYFISTSPEILRETYHSCSILLRKLPSPKIPVEAEARFAQQCQLLIVISTDAFCLS